MKSEFNFPRRINDSKNNIHYLTFPLDMLSGAEVRERRMVIFLGNDFRNLPGINIERTVQLTNKCLDYVRRECKGCDLFYKPHPAETDEHAMLNLEGFTVMKGVPVEILYMKHADEILHVFSTCSLASRTAYDLGFNSSLFMEPIAPSLDSRTMQGFRELFSMLPPACFINDLSQPLKENKKNSQEDIGILSENIKNLLKNRSGTVWMLVGDANNIPRVKVIEKLVKKHSPGTTFHLVPTRHHRWGTVPMDEIRNMFDAVSFVPRIFYSVRPNKILNALRVASLIRKWPVGKDDIIISSLGLSFSDDCFISYFRHVPRIALMPKDFFDFACGQQNFSAERYRRRLGATFFNYILEPFLGIEKTEYLESNQRTGWNIYRYVRPLNDIFDYAWVY